MTESASSSFAQPHAAAVPLKLAPSFFIDYIGREGCRSSTCSLNLCRCEFLSLLRSSRRIWNAF
ncbi:hypothetical protein TIFTF001_021584 [Ficus carica]|uniref:Uncharacterized protein n=1 Tax=Ficus carica TaxID=3494 RepID=A0AA88DAW3_FICCA|nr:hypothetical protein TIFTF001_021584 [Ficus carica]